MVGLPKALSQSFYEILDFHIYKRKIIHDFVVQKKKKIIFTERKANGLVCGMASGSNLEL